MLNNIVMHKKNWIHLKINQLEYWFQGYVEVAGQVYLGESIIDLLANYKNGISEEEIGDWQGEFAFVYRGVEGIFATVDRKRTIPLYYFKSENNEWNITDTIVLGESNDNFNNLALQELLIAGFCVNSKTALENYFQLEAGQCISIKGSEVKVKSYFSFTHQPEEIVEEDAVAELKIIMHQAINRLYNQYRNKKIFIPLSGGNDSRIITLLIKEYGFSDIETFTYGKSGNNEAAVSSEIAEKLGVNWRFIEYTPEKWYHWYHSQAWKEYTDFSANLSTLAHIQDWPAVGELVTELNQGEAVFVPGHVGVGGHIPPHFMLAKSYTKEDVIQELMRRHFRLWETKNQDVYRTITNELYNSIDGCEVYNSDTASSAIEYWFWKERQAKFILNSLRVYEYYNQNWSVPLWDDQILAFYKKLPVGFRYNKYLYKLTLHKMYPDYFQKPSKEIRQPKIQNDSQLYKLLKKIYLKKATFEQYYKNQMGWFGISGNYLQYLQDTSFVFNGKKYSQPYNINSIIAKDYVTWIVNR